MDHLSSFHYFLISEAFFRMVVDYSTCLQMKIYRHRAKIFKPSLFQIPSDLIRKSVLCGNSSLLMSHVQNYFTLRKALQIITECTKFLPNFQKTLSIMNHLPESSSQILSFLMFLKSSEYLLLCIWPLL